jgi:hypothetical protein
MRVFRHAASISLTLRNIEITERMTYSSKAESLRFAYTVNLFIRVFIIPEIYGDYLPTYHKPVGLCNGNAACLPRGRN